MSISYVTTWGRHISGNLIVKNGKEYVRSGPYLTVRFIPSKVKDGKVVVNGRTLYYC